MAAPDGQLIRSALTGDKQAFSELVRRHQARVLAAALHLSGEREAALDLAQETFVEAYRSLGSLRDHDRFASWLYGILRNQWRHSRRRREPAALSLERDDVPEPASPSDDPIDGDLVTVVASLPSRHREILAARYLHDQTYAEIAAAHGITVQNARVRCFGARVALREALAAAGTGAATEGGVA